MRQGGCFKLIFNILAVVVVLGILVGAVIFALLLFFPEQTAVVMNVVGIGEFPAPAGQQATPTLVPVAVLPSAVPTSTRASDILPTFTPPAGAPTIPAGPTNTRRPTDEPTITSTLPPSTPTRTPTATPTLTPTATLTPLPGPPPTQTATRSAFPFTKDVISPIYLTNFANNAQCSWMGIAGEVMDLNRNQVPAGSFRVHVWGSAIDSTVTVGTAPAYAPSGWEVFLNNSPSVRDYNVQLLSPEGTPVSQVYLVQTRASCEENLVYFVFVQNH